MSNPAALGTLLSALRAEYEDSRGALVAGNDALAVTLAQSGIHAQQASSRALQLEARVQQLESELSKCQQEKAALAAVLARTEAAFVDLQRRYELDMLHAARSGLSAVRIGAGYAQGEPAARSPVSTQAPSSSSVVVVGTIPSPRREVVVRPLVSSPGVPSLVPTSMEATAHFALAPAPSQRAVGLAATPEQLAGALASALRAGPVASASGEPYSSSSPRATASTVGYAPAALHPASGHAAGVSASASASSAAAASAASGTNEPSSAAASSRGHGHGHDFAYVPLGPGSPAHAAALQAAQASPAHVDAIQDRAVPVLQGTFRAQVVERERERQLREQGFGHGLLHAGTSLSTSLGAARLGAASPAAVASSPVSAAATQVHLPASPSVLRAAAPSQPPLPQSPASASASMPLPLPLPSRRQLAFSYSPAFAEGTAGAAAASHAAAVAQAAASAAADDAALRQRRSRSPEAATAAAGSAAAAAAAVASSATTHLLVPPAAVSPATVRAVAFGWTRRAL